MAVSGSIPLQVTMTTSNATFTPHHFNWTSNSVTFLPHHLNWTSAAPVDPACELYRIVINTIIAVLCIFGTMGNVVVFIVFWLDTVKTSSSFLFQALAVVDTFFLVTVTFLFVPRSMQYYSDYLQAYVNIYIFPLAMISQTAAMWGTVLIAVNRFIAVCVPFQAVYWCTVRQARLQFTCLIMCAVLYCIPEFFRVYFSVEPRDGAPNATLVNRVQYTALGKTYAYQHVYKNYMYIIFLLSLPLTIVTFLNVRLIGALNTLRKKRSEMQSLRQQQDNNITLVLIIVIFVFIFCQAPALVNQIFWNIPALKDSSKGCTKFHAYFREITNTLVTFNSAVNFVIYYLFNTRFRQVFYETFTCCQTCVISSPVSQSKATAGINVTKRTNVNGQQKVSSPTGTRDTLL